MKKKRKRRIRTRRERINLGSNPTVFLTNKQHLQKEGQVSIPKELMKQLIALGRLILPNLDTEIALPVLLQNNQVLHRTLKVL